MSYVSNSRWLNCKESPNRSTNNGDKVEKSKRDDLSRYVSEYHIYNYRAAELLKINRIIGYMILKIYQIISGIFIKFFPLPT